MSALTALTSSCRTAPARRPTTASKATYWRQCYGPRVVMPPVLSVKAHIGHTAGASGLFSLLAAALALAHRKVPAGYCERPDPATRIRLPSRDAPLRAGRPLRALINACGFGGNNVSLVLQEGRARAASISWPALTWRPAPGKISGARPARLRSSTRTGSIRLSGYRVRGIATSTTPHATRWPRHAGVRIHASIAASPPSDSPSASVPVSRMSRSGTRSIRP